MQTLTQPTLLLKPFAESGDKNTIPSTNMDTSNPQLADLTNGFPAITSEDPDNGGLPPERKDFNGLGYLTTTYDYFYQAGGTFTFNPTISTAIGGYPLNARLWYTDSNGISCILRSTIENNTNNFLTDTSVIGLNGSGKPWVIESFRGIGLNEQYVTNCITEIPQDINLELSSGTLTLKAGSNVYVPNGSGVFDDVTIASDMSNSISTYATGTYVVFYNRTDNGLTFVTPSNCSSGTTAPSTGFCAWYDTTSNLIKFYNNGSYLNKVASFPLCIVSYTNGTGTTSINQVFNGFGYIGSTVYALPDVKGLIPNGRNSDGTLKNTSFTTSGVLTASLTGTDTNIGIWVGAANLNLSKVWKYNEDINLTKDASGNTIVRCFAGSFDIISGTISNLNPKTVFHSVDYNDAVKYSDKETVVGWGMPNYSAGVSVSNTGSYTAQSNGYIFTEVSGGGSDTFMYINGIVVGFGQWTNTNVGNFVSIPMKSGDTLTWETGRIARMSFVPCLGG